MHEVVINLISKVNRSEMDYELKQELIHYLTNKEKQTIGLLKTIEHYKSQI